MGGTAWEARMKSYTMFFYGCHHMDVPVLSDQQRLTSACADTGCTLEDCQVWWMVGMDGEFGNSLLSVQFDATAADDNIRGARGVMVIVVGNGDGDMSSNPGRDWLHFT